MKSFLEALKDNDKEFEVKREEKGIEEEVEEPSQEYNFKNIEDEFEHLHNYDLICIKTDFMEYLRYNYLPFLNNYMNKTEYTLMNFIKYNCTNYYKLEDDVNKYNEELINEDKEGEDDDYGYDYDIYEKS
jgi:hypothetical protein